MAEGGDEGGFKYQLFGCFEDITVCKLTGILQLHLSIIYSVPCTDNPLSMLIMYWGCFVFCLIDQCDHSDCVWILLGLYSYFCACVAVGELAETLGDSKWIHCCLFTTIVQIFSVLGSAGYVAYIVGQVREQRGIEVSELYSKSLSFHFQVVCNLIVWSCFVRAPLGMTAC